MMILLEQKHGLRMEMLILLKQKHGLEIELVILFKQKHGLISLRVCRLGLTRIPVLIKVGFHYEILRNAMH